MANRAQRRNKKNNNTPKTTQALSRSSMLKIVGVIATLVIVMVAGVFIYEKVTEYSDPVLKNDNTVVLEHGDVKVTSNDIYESLKNVYGYELLTELFDNDLILANHAPDDEDVKELIDEEIQELYEDGSYENFVSTYDASTGEYSEAGDVYEDFRDTYSSKGLNSPEDIYNHFKLEEARRLYAKEIAIKEIIDEEDVEDDEKEEPLKTKYEELNLDACGIVLKYKNLSDADDALEALDFDNNTPVEQVLAKFIELSGINTTTLAEENSLPQNVYVDIDEEKIEDLIEQREEGKYKYPPSLTVDCADETDQSYLPFDLVSDESLKDYIFEDLGEGENVYSDTWKKLGSGYYLVFRSNDVTAMPEFGSAEAKEIEIYLTNQILDDALTTSYITEKLNELYFEKDVKFYDSRLDEYFANEFEDYDANKKAKGSNNNIIAVVDGKEYTTDDVYELLVNRYGMSIAIDRISGELLKSEGFNLSKSDQKDIDNQVADARASFISSGYASYITFNDYLSMTYGVPTESSYREMLEYEKLLEKYYEENPLEEDDLVDAYENWFEISAIHILVEFNTKIQYGDKEISSVEDLLKIADGLYVEKVVERIVSELDGEEEDVITKAAYDELEAEEQANYELIEWSFSISGYDVAYSFYATADAKTLIEEGNEDKDIDPLNPEDFYVNASDFDSDDIDSDDIDDEDEDMFEDERDFAYAKAYAILREYAIESDKMFYDEDGELVDVTMSMQTSLLKSLASKYSDDSSASENSGDLGYFYPDQMVEEFEAKAKELAGYGTAVYTDGSNKFGGPVETDFGFHIIMVTDEKELPETDEYHTEDEIEDLGEDYEANDYENYLNNVIKTTLETKRNSDGEKAKMLAEFRKKHDVKFENDDLQKLYAIYQNELLED